MTYKLEGEGFYSKNAKGIQIRNAYKSLTVNKVSIEF